MLSILVVYCSLPSTAANYNVHHCRRWVQPYKTPRSGSSEIRRMHWIGHGPTQTGRHSSWWPLCQTTQESADDVGRYGRYAADEEHLEA
jgi:hypothetical protein